MFLRKSEFIPAVVPTSDALDAGLFPQRNEIVQRSGNDMPGAGQALRRHLPGGPSGDLDGASLDLRNMSAEISSIDGRVGGAPVVTVCPLPQLLMAAAVCACHIGAAYLGVNTVA